MASPVLLAGIGWAGVPGQRQGGGSQAEGLGVGNNTAFPGPQGVGRAGGREERVTRGGHCHEFHRVLGQGAFLSPKQVSVTLFLFIIYLVVLDLSRVTPRATRRL